jgi:lipopolysaccharide biosynthesis protein
VNRLCLFAHYDRDNLVDDYVLYYLEGLKQVSTRLVFITTANLSANEINKVKDLADKVILRENIGYDFMSWQRGMREAAGLTDPDEIIICNDSVYGPIYPLDGIFKAMTPNNCDFWGMTDSYEIAYHLQSYFLVFKKKVVFSPAFREFWDSVTVEGSKDDVIRKYEVGMTQALVSAGFKPGAYAPSPSSRLKVLAIKASLAVKSPGKALRRIQRTLRGGYQERIALTPTLFLWKDLILKSKMPFIKIVLLRDSGDRIDIKGYDKTIRKISGYDTGLIQRHLERMQRKKRA